MLTMSATCETVAFYVPLTAPGDSLHEVLVGGKGRRVYRSVSGTDDDHAHPGAALIEPGEPFGKIACARWEYVVESGSTSALERCLKESR